MPWQILMLTWLPNTSARLGNHVPLCDTYRNTNSKTGMVPDLPDSTIPGTIRFGLLLHWTAKHANRPTTLWLTIIWQWTYTKNMLNWCRKRMRTLFLCISLPICGLIERNAADGLSFNRRSKWTDFEHATKIRAPMTIDPSSIKHNRNVIANWSTPFWYVSNPLVLRL